MERPPATAATTHDRPGWSRRRAGWAAAVCLVAAAVIVAYWSVWYTDRSLLASSTAPGYLDFENAFPLADAWLAVTLLLAATACLTRRATSARLWLTASASSGLYLLGMDVLYDIEHRVWSTGGNAGLVEALVNLLTFIMSVLLWRLLPPTHRPEVRRATTRPR